MPRIPHHTFEDLILYKENRRPMASFLEAFLSNDLMLTCALADDMNRPNIHNIAKWIDNNLPKESFGSKEAYNLWIQGYEDA